MLAEVIHGFITAWGQDYMQPYTKVHVNLYLKSEQPFCNVRIMIITLKVVISLKITYSSLLPLFHRDIMKNICMAPRNRAIWTIADWGIILFIWKGQIYKWILHPVLSRCQVGPGCDYCIILNLDISVLVLLINVKGMMNNEVDWPYDWVNIHYPP